MTKSNSNNFLYYCTKHESQYFHWACYDIMWKLIVEKEGQSYKVNFIMSSIKQSNMYRIFMQ